MREDRGCSRLDVDIVDAPRSMCRKEAIGDQQRGKVPRMHLNQQAIGLNSVVVAVGCLWFYSVTRTIPAPYLV